MKKTTICELWKEYRTRVLLPNVPPIQVHECRQAFYAGIASIMRELLRIGETNITEDEGEQIIHKYMDEIISYIETARTRHGITTPDN